MAQKHGTGHFKAIKRPARILLTGFFLFFGLFVFSNYILAESPAYNYNFEVPEYFTGNINGQEKWVGSGSSTVSTDAKLTGDQGIKLDNTDLYQNSILSRTGDEIISGETVFNFYIPTPGSGFDFWITLNNSTVGNVSLELLYNAGNFNNFLPGSCPTVSPNTWNTFKIKWDSSNSTSTYQLDCGSGYITANFTNNLPIGKGFSTLSFRAESEFPGHGHGKVYLDAISTPIDPPASTELTGATITPVFPPGNSTTTVSGGSFNSIGLYSFPTSTDFFIIGIDAVFTDQSDSSKRFIFNYDPGEITSGSYTITGGLPDGTYDLTWRYVYILDDTVPILLARYYYYVPAFDPAKIVSVYSIYSSETDFYPAIPQDDCSILTGVEGWLCDIKNFFSGIFYVSPAKTSELNTALDKMKNKFPYNYIEVDKNFFTDLKSGINSTSTISLKIMGNTQNINFGAIQNSTGTVAGTTQNTATVLKNLFSVIILFGFLIYAINFGRRIFK